MEQVYKTALEILLAMCKSEAYLREEDVEVICKTALKEREEKEI